jgi:hypothetical protein
MGNMVKVIRSQRELEEYLRKKVAQLVFETHRVIVENTPVGKSTPGDEWQESYTGGNLRRSIIVERTGENSWTIGTAVPYAEWVEQGLEPHEIKPVNKKALYWVGAPHPVKRVMHPGFEGRFMFQKGISFAEERAKTIFKE